MCNANHCVLLICQVKNIPPGLTSPQLFPGSILLPLVNGVDASACHPARVIFHDRYPCSWLPYIVMLMSASSAY